MAQDKEEAFDLNEVIVDASIDAEEKKKALKRKARTEKSKADQEEKRGEAVSDDEEIKDQEETIEQDTTDTASKPKEKVEKAAKEPKHGVWVGNLAFSTTSDAVRKFFKECGKITRIKCPSGDGPKKNNKGFAYVFFDSAEAVEAAVAKSEQKLDGRALLIKDANNYERKDGAPAPSKEVKKQKNPPCPTVFLGNLSFETTREMIQEHFAWCGPIRKVRLATFEDSGKCKGFAYIDFETVESATKAVRAPDRAVLDNRKLRVEFGSEEAHKRSMPWLKRAEKRQATETSTAPIKQQEPAEQKAETEEGKPERRPKKLRVDEDKPKRTKKPGRIAPGEALRTAQRQKPSVQKFEGTKITFGDD
ncbi:hypothetical protein EC973_000295 [Apophysomyces ossiformis]|uniref:RRM domain-containing protein n=1 Tax=Apophysomyces ossiformis TaxID=679940 RepID=A0A8H7BRK2_9FUNG|nr:hypothetical protein EC973_000295 [Apophysomyces ossiformis]